MVLANVQRGETVLDIGSNDGMDVLISVKHAGETAKFYELDLTDEILELANQNKKKKCAC